MRLFFTAAALALVCCGHDDLCCFRLLLLFLSVMFTHILPYGLQIYNIFVFVVSQYFIF